MEKLHDFTPILTGTIPIGIDTDESDLDIICCWNDKPGFERAVSVFSIYADFKLINKIIKGYETVIARFCLEDFRFEIFGQNRPVTDQDSYRHMIIEHRILQEKGDEFKQQIIELKKKGYKTEPAFGMLLGLNEDPYEELLGYGMSK